ncbi:hypothetical protein F4813DRAFT_33252 [Daldinia decipiens]|uniref:uncharacterized protein n=1 Tax=Daldinia decipiens TaxID=326647 RepID=UPI0020C2AA84|nr:uncharacterized protein F4813DRAFT_33252 [Daldinia decipiens]KAI1658901.1 hypothetical protein F4813DRAFT_33252 [Daldinia decipiens]
MTLTPELETTLQHPLFRYKYRILIGTYLATTNFFLYRVYRQSFSWVIRSGQYETIFKGTALAAVIGGVVMSSAGRAKYRQYKEESLSLKYSNVQMFGNLQFIDI